MSTPERLPAFDYVGPHRYFVTICAHSRAPHFVSNASVALVQQHILQTSAEYGFEITAYCYMPDHWHGLLTGIEEAAEFRPALAMAKQRSAWHFSRRHRSRLWQPGYFDRVLRDDEATPDVIAYIVNNPLRAGIVGQPVDYPYWGSSKFTRGELLEFIAGASSTWRP